MSRQFCARPLNCTTTFGTLTIGGLSLHGPAWCAFDLSPLTDSPEFRDSNILVESLPGRAARPTVVDQTDYSLRMMLSGYSNQAGVPWSNPAGGLLANKLKLIEELVEPIQQGTSSLAGVLTVPHPESGNIVYTFDCQPLRITVSTPRSSPYARGVLELRVPVPELATT